MLRSALSVLKYLSSLLSAAETAASLSDPVLLHSVLSRWLRQLVVPYLMQGIYLQSRFRPY